MAEPRVATTSNAHRAAPRAGDAASLPFLPMREIVLRLAAIFTRWTLVVPVVLAPGLLRSGDSYDASARSVAPPSNTYPPQLSGVATEYQTLTTSDGTWSSTPPLTSSATRGAAATRGEGVCQTIASANAQTTALLPADVGSRGARTAQVTATNSARSALEAAPT